MQSKKEIAATNLCARRVKIARVSKDMKQIDVAVAMNVDHGIDKTFGFESLGIVIDHNN